MEPTKTPRRRPNIAARTAGLKRIYQRLRERWPDDDIATEEDLSAARARQTVARQRRVSDRGEPGLRIERLRPAQRLPGKAVARGELRAIDLLVRLVDRVDRRERKIAKPLAYTAAHRQRLLDKLNRMAATLADNEAAPLLTGNAAKQAREDGTREYFFRPPSP